MAASKHRLFLNNTKGLFFQLNFVTAFKTGVEDQKLRSSIKDSVNWEGRVREIRTRELYPCQCLHLDLEYIAISLWHRSLTLTLA